MAAGGLCSLDGTVNGFLTVMANPAHVCAATVDVQSRADGVADLTRGRRRDTQIMLLAFRCKPSPAACQVAVKALAHAWAPSEGPPYAATSSVHEVLHAIA